ncbi:cytochrome b5 domain-containing protein [Bacillus sp. JJ1122]|uniref:cytochrome b5 domain-containing protein n=1 Tax=Bacillus sp. JJ1122 TaxID=3122951 RepID=UPI0030008A15
MANHHLIDSEIAATFSELHYLIHLIYATGNPRERYLALSQLWEKVSYLHHLVAICQTERNKALLQHTKPHAIHPFHQIQTETIPVQGRLRINEAQAGHSVSQLYPLTQPQPVYPTTHLSPSQTQLVFPTTQLPMTQPRPAYPATHLFSSQPQPAYLVTEPSRIQPQTGIPVTQPSNPNGQTFTKEQLAQFTGLNGMPAYVAVNGVVYDVTNNAAWSLATHFGLSAGKDWTAEFASCHAGQQWILAQLKPIGRLVQ